MHLNDAIVFYSISVLHLQSIRAFLGRLVEERDSKFPPSKSQFGATMLYILGRSVSPLGPSLDLKKIEALRKMPIPASMVRLRPVIDDRWYYPSFLPSFPKGLQLIKVLFKEC